MTGRSLVLESPASTVDRKAIDALLRQHRQRTHIRELDAPLNRPALSAAPALVVLMEGASLELRRDVRTWLTAVAEDEEKVGRAAAPAGAGVTQAERLQFFTASSAAPEATQTVRLAAGLEPPKTEAAASATGASAAQPAGRRAKSGDRVRLIDAPSERSRRFVGKEGLVEGDETDAAAGAATEPGARAAALLRVRIDETGETLPLRAEDVVVLTNRGGGEESASLCTVVVSGAGGVGVNCNGGYVLDRQFKGKPVYKMVGSPAIIYFSGGMWKLNDHGSTSGWYYSIRTTSTPPIGQWTHEGYDSSDADPCPISFAPESVEPIYVDNALNSGVTVGTRVLDARTGVEGAVLGWRTAGAVQHNSSGCAEEGTVRVRWDRKLPAPRAAKQRDWAVRMDDGSIVFGRDLPAGVAGPDDQITGWTTSVILGLLENDIDRFKKGVEQSRGTVLTAQLYSKGGDLPEGLLDEQGFYRLQGTKSGKKLAEKGCKVGHTALDVAKNFKRAAFIEHLRE